jgi:hypothetical protein
MAAGGRQLVRAARESRPDLTVAALLLLDPLKACSSP